MFEKAKKYLKNQKNFYHYWEVLFKDFCQKNLSAIQKDSTINDFQNITQGYFIMAYSGRFFSQEKFENEHASDEKLLTQAVKAREIFGGLCQAFCNLVVIFGHNSDEIKSLMNWEIHKNSSTPNHSADMYKKCLEIINNIAWDGHILSLMTSLEKDLSIVLNIYPESTLLYSEQQKILFIDDNNKCKINKTVLSHIMERINHKTYLQFSTIFLKKQSELDLGTFSCGHAMLIFKTMDPDLMYHFFDPAAGFNNFSTLDELHEKLECMVADFNDLSLQRIAIIDSKKILLRSQYCQKLMEKVEHETESLHTMKVT